MKIFFTIAVMLSWLASPDREFKMRPERGSARVTVEAADGSKLTYEPEFIIISSDKNPNKKLRRGDFGFVKDRYNPTGLLYNVPTWGKPDNFVANPDLHVEDGFNPEYDRAYGKDRTANYFQSGKSSLIRAVRARRIKGAIVWEFPENEDCILEARLDFDGEYPYPRLRFRFTPKKDGWYSVGYGGQGGCLPSDVTEIWQPQIWTEKRFPNVPFLSESFRLPIPGCLMTVGGITSGVMGDPRAVPFENLTPTSDKSRFGAMIRNASGLAQPLLFAPVLGNADSKMKAGRSFEFSMYLYQGSKPLTGAFEEIARRMCSFSDFRRNTTCNLNTTIDNMVEFVQSPWAMFTDSLKGFNYSTDVPGAVKNISGLHLLESAVLTDDEALFRRMARPMFEYGLSRERFLFSTDSTVRGQGTSSRLNGPGVPVSDLLETCRWSSGRIGYMLEEALRLYDSKAVRSINTDSFAREDRWINSLSLYKATGERKYLDRAVEDCDRYLESRVNRRQNAFDDPYSIGWFFWTSFTNQWMELLQMFDATGYRRYLDAAEDGALHYALFCWMLPVVPEGKITVNPGGNVPVYSYRNNPKKYKFMKAPEAQVDAWKLSEIGLTPESSGTAAGHRAIFMAHHAPFMMRIAALTGNKFLHDIARNAVVGRYECFPGYHINTGRTNVYEDKYFAWHPQRELNAHTSIHYNHIPSFLAMLWDYLFADFYYVSGRAIDFPYAYSEGYAYCRSLVFGNAPGRFYDIEGVQPYMPAGIVHLSDVQANYICGYADGKFCLALSNQSDGDIDVTVSFDPVKSFVDPSRSYPCRVWEQNAETDAREVLNGRLTLRVKARGITAVSLDGVKVKTMFQSRLGHGTGPGWTLDHCSAGFFKDRAVLMDFGPGLRSVYVWNEADNTRFSRVVLHYSIDGAEERQIPKTGYPYEYTVEIPDGASSFSYRFEAFSSDGRRTVSEPVLLSR